LVLNARSDTLGVVVLKMGSPPHAFCPSGVEV
jgi:hypothetical protein